MNTKFYNNLKTKTMKNEMKTWSVTAHYSHSVFYTVKAKSEEEAIELIKEIQFGNHDSILNCADGNFEELLSIENPENEKR